MKKIINKSAHLLIITLAHLLINTSIFAQAPQKMSYQAVIRNTSGALVTSTSVGMKISILQGTATGTVAYSETQTASTNANGLVSLEIGSGTVVLGTFASINWATGPYFIKTETDPLGGTNYSITGTNQLMSVPYALFSANGTPGPAGPQGATGAQGIQGFPGTNGTNGSTGATGPAGPTGAQGIQGLTGATGPQGATGAQGIQGFPGTNGTNGSTGATGPAGPTGAQGIQGLTGATGPQGPAGATGITITSVSSAGDTLYLSNGQIFVAAGNTGGTGALVLPTITTNAVTAITSNSATFGGAISNANGNQIMERGIVYSTTPNPTLVANKIVIGNGIGTFDTISGLGGLEYAYLLNSNTTYYVRAYAVTENNISAYGNEVSFTTLSVGQTGPGGGIIFFNKGNTNGGWQYLESATSDQSTGIAWGCDGTSIPGTQLTVGSGEVNTSLIVAGCNEAGFAAKLCNDLVTGGQSDWFLPSRDELNLMYKNMHLNSQGNFNTSAYYWSSTELNFNYAWGQGFNFGIQSSSNKNFNFFSVRAVRAF
jgi:hypothetical protein